MGRNMQIDVQVIEEQRVPLTVEIAALSDVGCVRKNNEDAFGYDSVENLFVVCDGVGGTNSGEIASALAVSTALDTFAASESGGAPIEVRLNEAIVAANLAVREAAIQPQNRGMGTTLVAAAIDASSGKEKLLIGNVGDSRGYMLQDGKCMQLTVDHSYLNELIRSGAIKVEDAGKVNLEGMASVITRAIGAARSVEADFFLVDLQPGDIVLLASDGLTRYLTPADIAQRVSADDLQLSCERLIDEAKDRGGIDNITCLLLRFSEAPPAA
jgi:PPM family protein phosphatase